MSVTAKLARFAEIGKKIVGVARNYREHAKELGNAIPSEPFVFLKPTSAYITEGQPIKLPKEATEIHYEVELGLVIGERGRDIPEDSALSHIGGYILALDMTNRIAQTSAKQKGLPWSVAKGFDTSCPVSSFIAKDKIADPQDVGLWLNVNGEKRQEGNTRDMIFSVPYLVSWISGHFTLEPGDVILTGTPQGVGPVRDGDVIHCGLADLVQMKFLVEKR